MDVEYIEAVQPPDSIRLSSDNQVSILLIVLPDADKSAYFLHLELGKAASFKAQVRIPRKRLD